MARDVVEIGVGMAVVAGLVSVLAFSYGYGGSKWKGGAGYPLIAAFNRVDGLGEGAQVHLGGIRIGTVERQTLDERYRAVVTLRIDSNVRLPIDTAAAIHTDGLFGDKFVVLDPGGEAQSFKAGDTITFTQDAVRVDELLEQIIAQGKARRDRKAGAGDQPAARGGK